MRGFEFVPRDSVGEDADGVVSGGGVEEEVAAEGGPGVRAGEPGVEVFGGGVQAGADGVRG